MKCDQARKNYNGFANHITRAERASTLKHLVDCESCNLWGKAVMEERILTWSPLKLLTTINDAADRLQKDLQDPEFQEIYGRLQTETHTKRRS